MKKIVTFSFVALIFLGLLYGAWNLWIKGYSSDFINPLPKKDPVSQLHSLLQEKKIPLASQDALRASDSAILATLSDNNTQVLFSAEKDLASQVGTLQIILGRLTIEGKDAKTIDLRFSDPIVIY